MAGELESEVEVKQMEIHLDKMRSLVRDYIDKHQYETAVYWADKLVSLSGGSKQDIYWYAHSLFLTGQYHRAAHLLKSHKLDKINLTCRYLAAKCYHACKEHQEALDVLDQTSDNSTLGHPNISKPLLTESIDSIPESNMESSMNLLRGYIYEAMDNRGLAAECFREALRADVRCFEAFNALVNHQMLSAQEERELLDSLPYKKQCPEEELELIQFLYRNKLKKYNKPGELAVPSSLDQLNNNLDIIVSLAERHYYNCDFRECFKITTVVLNRDPFNLQCLPLHIAVLVELQKANALFYLAHKLVDMYPERAVSWFAVGCYYLLIGKNEPARRYLSKATTLDRVYGPAWLAFGHSFAVEKEHDQAMAAYFTASQLMKGCHLPVLYIGLEYGLTNNHKLAERFFGLALTIAPEDPFVLHEMGVIAFHNKDWEQAEKYFKSALEKVQVIGKEVVMEKWEPLLNDLGHTCRKLKKYEDALEYHRQALILCPQNPSTLSAIGYVHALTGNLNSSVDYFHKALGLRRDDTFSMAMLGSVMEQLMNEMSPCDGAPDEVPLYTDVGKLEVSQQEDDSDIGGGIEQTPQQTFSGVLMDSSSNMSIDSDI